MPYLACSSTVLKYQIVLTISTITVVPSIDMIVNNQLGITKGYFHLFVLTLSSQVEMKLFLSLGSLMKSM